ncbi:RHS repeat domain-containing protein, partial [Pseudomonas anuradhapurensis]
EVKPQAFDAILWYQCDHLGTPMELTDHNGEMAWTAQYKAWGELRRPARSGLNNPIRFQGQYHDHETGRHYNRHRYYCALPRYWCCRVSVKPAVWQKSLFEKALVDIRS